MNFFKGVAIVTTSILLSAGALRLGQIVLEEQRARRADKVFWSEVASAGSASEARTQHALKTIRVGLITIVRHQSFNSYEFPVHNAGDKPMRDVSVRLALKDARGKWLAGIDTTIDVISPGKTVRWSTTDETARVATAEFTCIRWPEGMICDGEGTGIPRFRP